MMTRVDVSNVAIVTTGDGSPVFMAEDVGARVDARGLWLSLSDAEGNVFAVARLPPDRAMALVNGAGRRLKR